MMLIKELFYYQNIKKNMRKKNSNEKNIYYLEFYLLSFM
jgi:hypothetical protein